ncbi:MAG: hypothetical protein ACOYLF_07415 [Blastocatellia bacterium]
MRKTTGSGDGGWRETFREALRLFFLSIGISNSGGRRLRPDLTKVVTRQGWQVENCTPSIVDHEGKWALRLDSLPGEGEVWLADHRFKTGKIDFCLAAVEQKGGFLLQPLSGDSADRLSFSFSVSEEMGIELTLHLETASPCEESRHYFPLKMKGEWIPVRIVLSREHLSVFVDRDHVPTLKALHGHSAERPARIGIWRGSGAMVLIAALRLIETHEWNLT